MSYNTHKRAGRRARTIAGAEALAVARRPEVASREKNPAAAGIRGICIYYYLDASFESHMYIHIFWVEHFLSWIWQRAPKRKIAEVSYIHIWVCRHVIISTIKGIYAYAYFTGTYFEIYRCAYTFWLIPFLYWMWQRAPERQILEVCFILIGIYI